MSIYDVNRRLCVANEYIIINKTTDILTNVTSYSG